MSILQDLKVSQASGCGFLCSFPKSGRTWLRFVLCQYFNLVLGLGRDVSLQNMFDFIPNDDTHTARGRGSFAFGGDRRMPRIYCSHRSFAEVGVRAEDKVVYMLRSPADVLVSYYFHRTRQYKELDMTLEAFMVGAKGAGGPGVMELAGYLNDWAGALGRHALKHVVTYEAMQTDAAAVVEGVLRFLDFPVHRASVATAVELSTFARMQEVELAKGIRDVAYDAGDVEARRVRKGKVGGYQDYLNEEQVAAFRAALGRALTGEAAGMLAGAGIGY